MSNQLSRTIFILLFITISPSLSYGAWQIDRAMDPINDKITLTAGIFKEGRITLGVVCSREESLGVGIDWGGLSPFGISFSNKKRKKEIIVRFDKEKPLWMEWILGSKGRMTFLFKDIDPGETNSFIEKLKNHYKLAVRARKYNGGTKTMIFSLKGSTYPIEMAEYTCGLRNEKPKKSG